MGYDMIIISVFFAGNCYATASVEVIVAKSLMIFCHNLAFLRLLGIASQNQKVYRYFSGFGEEIFQAAESPTERHLLVTF